MTPPRVLVVQISQRSKFSQVENEYTLLCECKVIIAQKREKIEFIKLIRINFTLVATGVAVEQLEHVHPALLCRGREEKIILSLSLFIIQCQLKRGQSKTWAMQDKPMRNETKQTTAMKISLRRRNKRGHSSTTAVMKPSSVQNWCENKQWERLEQYTHPAASITTILANPIPK